MKSIVNAEILDRSWTTEKMFDLGRDHELVDKVTEEGDKRSLLNEHLVDMEFETYSPILNTGGIFFALCFYPVLMMAFVIVWMIVKAMKKFDNL